MGVTTTAKVVAATAVAIFGVTLTTTGSALAWDQPVDKGSVEISPVCASNNLNQATWKAYNKNAHENVMITWTNKDTGETGMYEAPAGTTTFQTAYKQNDKGEINNTTEFVMLQANDTVTRNATNEACEQPVEDDCMMADEVVSSDIHASFSDRYHAAVKYVGAKPLCDGEQVQINFSSYVITNPAYNGGYLLDNPTAIPQVLNGNHTGYLTNQTTELHLMLPMNGDDECKNVQIDVYRNEVLNGFNDLIGHGTRNVLSEMYPATKQNCNVNQPGQGGEQQGGNISGNFKQVTSGVFVTKTVEVNTTVTGAKGAAPAELANTGERSMVASILAGMFALSAAVVALAPRRVRA